MEYKTFNKNAGLTLAYIDARQVMDRLDEVVGCNNWQCDYKVLDGKMYCGVGIRVAVMDVDLRGEEIIGDHEWVWKWDMGTESEYEADKGEASDAFKRAAVRWGIGRFLYDIKSPQSAPQRATAPVKLDPIKQEFANRAKELMELPKDGFEEIKPKWSTEVTDKMCPECGSVMNKKTNNETGSSFIGCSNYPTCKHTEKEGS